MIVSRIIPYSRIVFILHCLKTLRLSKLGIKPFCKPMTISLLLLCSTANNVKNLPLSRHYTF